jgi:hypothetical protein
MVGLGVFEKGGFAPFFFALGCRLDRSRRCHLDVTWIARLFVGVSLGFYPHKQLASSSRRGGFLASGTWIA